MKDLFIFLHVPKTAGSSFFKSVTEKLEPHQFIRLYGIKKTSAMISEELGRLTQEARNQVEILGGHQVWYGVHKCFPNRTPRYIAFLRDPVARVISCYWKFRRKVGHPLYELLNDPSITLTDYLRGHVNGGSRLHAGVTNHMTAFLGRDHLDGNHNFYQCVDYDEQLLERAINNLRNFWYVGLKQSFQNDLIAIGNAMGLDFTEHQVNRPESRSQRSLTSLSDLELCSQNNRMDSILYHQAVLLHEQQYQSQQTVRSPSNMVA